MNPKVYIETSIPSFHYEVRSEPEMVARCNWTREWWSNERDHYLLVTSVAVLDELDRGSFPGKIEALDMMSKLLFVSIEPAIAEIVEVYIQQHLMPNDPVGDALHLALASYHKCDFLLTWNCRHLANANKFGHIRRVNAMLGLYVPTLVTPLELIGAQNDDEEWGN
ncbi:type II toxin-antitoxin system VapC family toxin [Nostoc sp. HG1]|nr:type II toxin-antitoxin system VapC family toxin [Nostoc sp. HG1]